MTDDTCAFLAEMILRLVPLGDKLMAEGKQASDYPRFTEAEIRRLVAIKMVEGS